MIGVEYDGYYYHKNEKDTKTNILLKNGIILISIKETINFRKDINNIIYVQLPVTEKKLKDTLERLLSLINKIKNIQIKYIVKEENNRLLILSNYRNLLVINSIFETHPQLLKEWNNEKNLKLNPKTITSSSHIKVWWICDKGHEWEALVSSRSRGNGCPYCSGRQAIIGENDLFTTNKVLLKEWNYKKNINVDPKTIKSGSNKKVWWICDKGHEWETTVNDRHQGSGCPYCSGNKLIQGLNDLASKNPIILKEWNYKKNINVDPKTIKSGSNKKVWWICDKGHEWETKVSDRNQGSGCPYCSGLKAIIGKNDIFTTNPELKNEWNYKKNINVDSKTIKSRSSIKVWWICDKGHEWEAATSTRTKGSGCPVCYKNNRKLRIKS
jgi:hypothetical protein